MCATSFVFKRVALILVLLIACACIVAFFTPTPPDSFAFILMIEGITLLIFGGVMYSMTKGGGLFVSWTRLERKAIDEARKAYDLSSQTRKALRRAGLYFALIGIILIIIGLGLSVIF